MSPIVKILSIIIVLASLNSCASLRPKKDELASKTLPRQYVDVKQDSQAQRMTWRTLFDDPNLASLIDTALARNYSRKVALSNLKAAQAELLRSKAPLIPQVAATLSGGAERFGEYTMNGVGNYDLNKSNNILPSQRVPNPVTDVFLGLRASWEIDIWHRLKSQKEAAAMRLLSTTEGVQWLNTNIVAAVATSYYELLALDAEIEAVSQSIELQRRALVMVEAQKEAGKATELAVQQFRAQVFEALSLLNDLEQRKVITENAIRLLTGKFDGDIVRSRNLQSQNFQQIQATGLPSQLLFNRPDLRQAELELLATNLDVYSARAAFMPSLVISPYAGLQAFNPALLISPQSAALGLLGGLVAPVFNRRGLVAERDSRVARREAALHTYHQNIVAAYLEVQTELMQLNNLKESYKYKSEEVAALQRAIEVSNDLYLAGYANYLEVITAQRNALKASLEQAEMRKLQLVNKVNLYRALGGG